MSCDMISPNCSVIMDVTTTTSTYNTIERSTSAEHAAIVVADSADVSNENKQTEELNQDPEDEDTLSDDSLRLRLSDDDADDIESCKTDDITAPSFGSEETPSQNADIGVSHSEDQVQLSSATQSNCPGSKEKSQGSPNLHKTLNKTHIGGKKNANHMWSGAKRREISSNSTAHRSVKRTLKGHSLHTRYNHSHSSINKTPSYFNNQTNFGRPPNYRNKDAAHWRHAKQKYLHSSLKHGQRNTAKEKESSSESALCSNSKETEIPRLSESSGSLSDSVTRSDDVVNDCDTASPLSNDHQSVGKKSETKLDTGTEQNRDSPRPVNYELSKECSHLNLNEESTCVGKTINSNEDLLTCGYDSKFTSDDWFDTPDFSSNNYIQPPETSSLNQNPSNCEDVGPISSIRATESADLTEMEPEVPIDDENLSQDCTVDSIDSCLSAKDTFGSDMGSKSIRAKIASNIMEADTPCSLQPEVKADGPVHEAAGASDEVSMTSMVSELPKVSKVEVILNESTVQSDHPERMEELETIMKTVQYKANNIVKAEEEEAINGINDNPEKQPLTPNVKAETEENANGNEATNSMLDEHKASKQHAKIETENKKTGEDLVEQCQEKCEADGENGVSSQPDNSLNKVADSITERAAYLENSEQNEKNILVCNESSDNLRDIPTGKIDATQKISPSNCDGNSGNSVSHMLKRSLTNTNPVAGELTYKKRKVTSDESIEVCVNPIGSENKPTLSGENEGETPVEQNQEAPKTLHYVRKFFQRDMKGKLSKLKREELEELIIQKLVETITMRSEIGRLREQARASERNQEATRVRCQQLSKQIKDFDMVLNRNTADRRSNNYRPVPPIKINRSVGLQVNFMTDHSIHSLRALSATNAAKPSVPNPIVANGGNRKTVVEKITHVPTPPRRGIKVRSPRRSEIPKNPSLPIPTQAATMATPAALVVSKTADTMHNLTSTIHGKEQTSQAVPTKKIIHNTANGRILNQVNRQTPVPTSQKPESNDLIDLTEEEDKNRTIGGGTSSGILPMIGTVTPSNATKVSHPRFQRVGHATMAGNLSTATPPANIRVVHSVAQPTPTALVNNINTTRLAYVMQGTTGPGRQLLIAPNPNQIRPVTSSSRGQFSNVTYKSGISTLANGSVRVITSAAPTIPNSQQPPAPLPDTPHYPAKNGWKLPPPPPSLKISKVTQGIVLSWNMVQSDTYAEIASYQLYAYQEIPGTPPSSNLWKKVGDVRALPLPMACTLKEFTPGNNYHFAVRAVDTHSRLGQYSVPRNISL